MKSKQLQAAAEQEHAIEDGRREGVDVARAVAQRAGRPSTRARYARDARRSGPRTSRKYSVIGYSSRRATRGRRGGRCCGSARSRTGRRLRGAVSSCGRAVVVHRLMPHHLAAGEQRVAAQHAEAPARRLAVEHDLAPVRPAAAAARTSPAAGAAAPSGPCAASIAVEHAVEQHHAGHDRAAGEMARAGWDGRLGIENCMARQSPCGAQSMSGAPWPPSRARVRRGSSRSSRARTPGRAAPCAAGNPQRLR